MYNDDKEYLDFLLKNNVIITSEPLSEFTDNTTSVNPNLKWQEIVHSYSKNKIVVVDNFLTLDCVERLRNFVLFYNRKEDFYKDYAAINFYTDNRNKTLFSGLCNIVNNIRNNFQPSDRSLDFIRAWSFIYNNESSGVTAHADPAAINFNFWVTPDQCMGPEPESNGLDLWKVYPPEDWSWEDYNRDENKILRYLDDHENKKISISYKQNRLVIFDSKFFHKSQPVKSLDGYENRRINYTLLFN